MIEKLKTKLVPKLLALFFIVFELFGVVEIMSMIFWQFDLPTTDYFYPVLNSLTILFVVVLVIYLKRIRPEMFQITSLKPLDYLLTLLAFGLIYAYYGKLLFVGANPDFDLVFFRHSPQAFLVALQPLVVGPILEELLYRGVLMTSFFEKSKYFLDCLLSAILFSFAHLLSYGFRLDLFEKYVVVGLILASPSFQKNTVNLPINSCSYGMEYLSELAPYYFCFLWSIKIDIV